MSDVSTVGTAGFFGKVRANGDFVSRRLPPEFIQPWDACLQRGMLQATHDLGKRWEACYAQMPPWHFLVGPDVCGASAWAGVLMASLDRVGRYFPLTIAAPIQADVLMAWLDGAQSWFDQHCAIAQSTLDLFNDTSTFDAALCAVPKRVIESNVPWRLNGVQIDSPHMTPAQIKLSQFLQVWSANGRAVWWCEDIHAVQGRLRAGFNLPTARQFMELFDSEGDAWGVAAVLKK